MSYLSCMARVNVCPDTKQLLEGLKAFYEYCGYSKEAQGPSGLLPPQPRKSGALGPRTRTLKNSRARLTAVRMTIDKLEIVKNCDRDQKVMNCDWTKENVVLYIYGELADDAKFEFEQHVRHCLGCRRERNRRLSSKTAWLPRR